MRRVSRHSPARGDAFHHGLRRLACFGLNCATASRPHHAEGAQLRYLEEIVGAGGKDKEDFRADFIDLEPALAEFGKILDPGGEGESKLLDDGSARLRIQAGANRKGSQQRRLAGSNFRISAASAKISCGVRELAPSSSRSPSGSKSTEPETLAASFTSAK